MPFRRSGDKSVLDRSVFACKWVMVQFPYSFQLGWKLSQASFFRSREPFISAIALHTPSFGLPVQLASQEKEL
jgi:hypothetical protein